MPKTILATGSAGFIGFHTAKALLDRGDTVIGFDNFNAYYDVSLKEARNKILETYENFKLYRADLENLEAVRGVFKENSVDAVCHLAAQAGVRYSLTHPHTYIQSNIVGFTNLIDEAKNAGIKTFVYASSSSVYGNNKKIPFSVKDNVDAPISLYAATKKANELIAHTYHHLFEMRCAGLRFFTVYGPFGRPDMALFKFTKAILNDEVIEVYNHGNMKRDFTYIDDIVSGIVSALDAGVEWGIFNLGNNKPEHLLTFIGEIERALGKKAKKQLLPLQPGDVPETFADIEETQKILGFEPKTPIQIGIPKFIAWYKEFYRRQ